MIQMHMEVLARTKHNLSQVTIAQPTDELPEDLKKYLDGLEESSHQEGTPIKIVYRENRGLSYGGWADGVSRFPDFDYHILIEDDYVPAKDNFDKDLVEIYEHGRRNLNSGFLCGLCRFRRKDHAAISNGIIASSVLPRLDLSMWDDQIRFSRSFQKVGLRITDWRDFFASPFYRESQQMVREHGDVAKGYLLVPFQLFWAIIETRKMLELVDPHAIGSRYGVRIERPLGGWKEASSEDLGNEHWKPL